MQGRFGWLGGSAAVVVATAFVLRAVAVHSVGAQPEIYRIAVANNDLDAVEGLAIPGKRVELWYRQRNFKEGDVSSDTDPFAWCAWKNGGQKAYLGATQANADGVFRFPNLRLGGTSVQMYPTDADGTVCRGGLYTEVLVRACDAPGVNCTADDVPTLNWLNAKRIAPTRAGAAGSVSGALQTAIAVADGPDDTDSGDDQDDVDQSQIDTTGAGFTPGQKVTWRCGAGGTAPCPTIAVYDPSTALVADPEYPFILATLQGHRPGGSIVAAAEIARPGDLGFQVNVDVTVRARADVNLGCDSPKPFGFKAPKIGL